MPSNTSFSSLVFLFFIVTLSACNKPEGCPYQYTMPNGTCKCDPGFEGDHCEIITDSCLAQASCGAHGQCVDGSCDCQAEYAGAHCEQFVPDEIVGNFTVVEYTHIPDDLGHLENPGFASIEVSKEQVSFWFDSYMPYYIQAESNHIYRVQFSGNDRLRIKEGFLQNAQDHKHWRLSSLWNECYLSTITFEYSVVYRNDSLIGKGRLSDYFDAKTGSGRGGPACSEKNRVRSSFIAVRSSSLRTK